MSALYARPDGSPDIRGGVASTGRYPMELYSDTFIPSELASVWVAARRCPHCVWPYLFPVRSLDDAHWLCESCGRCWSVEHGHLRRVDPVLCHGCAARCKDDCIEILRRESPPVGTVP